MTTTRQAVLGRGIQSRAVDGASRSRANRLSLVVSFAVVELAIRRWGIGLAVGAGLAAATAVVVLRFLPARESVAGAEVGELGMHPLANADQAA